MSRFALTRMLVGYGLAHALVDAACAALFFSALGDGRLAGESVVVAMLLYNTLAFAAQPLVGLWLDRLGRPRNAAIAGMLLTAIALIAAPTRGAVLPALALAGSANALFHVGGGMLALRATPGRALAPGVFVAPGAAGLALGALAGRTGVAPWYLAVALALVAASLALTPAPAPRRLPPSETRLGLEAVALLLLGVIAVRSYIGTAVVFPWKSAPVLLLALTAAVVLGKAAGGVLADRFGRARVAVGGLVLSLPFLLAGPAVAAAGVLGMLMFNLTMPVTLVALAELMPGHEGFAFGLTCLGLAVGALPVLGGVVPAGVDAVALVVLVLGASVGLRLALRPAENASLTEHVQGLEEVA